MPTFPGRRAIGGRWVKRSRAPSSFPRGPSAYASSTTHHYDGRPRRPAMNLPDPNPGAPMYVGMIEPMTVTAVSSSAAGAAADPSLPRIFSATSPLADRAHSRFFTVEDYHRFHERARRYDAENAFFARTSRRSPVLV
jgi:hypothetical protein